MVRVHVDFARANAEEIARNEAVINLAAACSQPGDTVLELENVTICPVIAAAMDRLMHCDEREWIVVVRQCKIAADEAVLARAFSARIASLHLVEFRNHLELLRPILAPSSFEHAHALKIIEMHSFKLPREYMQLLRQRLSRAVHLERFAANLCRTAGYGQGQFVESLFHSNDDIMVPIAPKDIRVEFAEMNDEQAAAVVDYFGSKTNLVRLGLMGNKITQLPTANGLLDHLQTLELAYMDQEMFDVDQSGLCNFVRDTRALTRLNFDWNQLTHDTVTRLFACFHNHPTLQAVYLDGVEACLTAESIDFIAEFVNKPSNRLRCLSLSGTGVSAAQMERFLEALRTHNCEMMDLRLFRRGVHWHGHADRQQMVDAYNVRNWAGRRLLSVGEQIPVSLWPHVFARINGERARKTYRNYREGWNWDPTLFADANYHLIRANPVWT